MKPDSATDIAAAARRWWWLYAIAAASFLPALGFYYVGEEAIFPKSALEMWYYGEPVRRLLFGVDLWHPPLFTWLIIPPSLLLGWEAVLPVTRGITVLATVLSGMMVASLAQVLYGQRLFSAVAAVTYLTLFDLFLYRGWLAYVDPLFSMLTFGAMAFLWIACERRHPGWLMLAVTFLIGAFLAKALTAYVFYAGAGLVLLFRGHHRLLLSPASVGLHLGGLAFPFAWSAWIQKATGQGTRMVSDIVAKMSPESLSDYVIKLGTYPLETFAGFAPAGLVALWLLFKRRRLLGEAQDSHLSTAGLIFLIGFLPYWLAPHSHVRYLLPLYPLAGLLIARVLWHAGNQALTQLRRWVIGMIVIKLMVVLIAFPLYQHHYRGANYAETARSIIDRTEGHALYTVNDSASGLAVSAYIDVSRLPKSPLTFPPAGWKEGFVIAYRPDAEIGSVVTQYRLGGNTLYLLCRGSACAVQPADGLRK